MKMRLPKFSKIKIEKKHLILVALVVALCATGVVNHRLNNLTGKTQPVVVKEPDDQGDVAETSAFFSGYRTTREANRDKEIGFLNEVIENEKTDAETLKDAMERKIAITKAMEMELLLENLIIAKGFGDCIVTINTGSINVVVDNDGELTAAQAAQIYEIVRRETGESAESVKILPKN